MACAYESQNSLGRLAAERVYENDLVVRLRLRGFTEVESQVPVTVEWNSFVRQYWLDLVVNHMVYELKTVASFTPGHDGQVINYAALLEIDRIKLINFRNPRVEGRLRRCPFPGTNRRDITVDRERFRVQTRACKVLSDAVESLVREIGGFLDASLYQEAIMHQFGGEEICCQRLPVVRDGINLGTHSVASHAEDHAFVITTLARDLPGYEGHLRRLLAVLPLNGWQWINIDRTQVRFVTLVDI